MNQMSTASKYNEIRRCITLKQHLKVLDALTQCLNIHKTNFMNMTSLEDLK